MCIRDSGSFDRILIAPLTRSSIVLAQLFEAVLCTFLEVGIMIALSLLFSVRFSLPLSGYLIFISLIFLTSFFMAGLSYGISMLLPNEVIYETVMNAIVLPVFFLSNALFPMTGITGFLHTACLLYTSSRECPQASWKMTPPKPLSIICLLYTSHPVHRPEIQTAALVSR